MRIGSSNIGMESTRRYHSLTARRASVTILAGNAGLRMNPGAEDGTEKKSIMGERSEEHTSELQARIHMRIKRRN